MRLLLTNTQAAIQLLVLMLNKQPQLHPKHNQLQPQHQLQLQTRQLLNQVLIPQKLLVTIQPLQAMQKKLSQKLLKLQKLRRRLPVLRMMQGTMLI